MRVRAPSAFRLRFSGPEGPYDLHFEATDEWDGLVHVTIGGVAMHWHVLNIEMEHDGDIVLGGMTHGSKPLWDDQFWFELRPNALPPLLRYWRDRVVWRQDDPQ
jgi:hypothetical protein